jgi:hypothetical protein
LKLPAESCARQLRAWAAGLQDSPIEGQRRLSDAARERLEKSKRADEFVKMLQTKYKKADFKNPQDST